MSLSSNTDSSNSRQDAVPPQILRLATVFTGGVSLAVWMGGVARELNLLVNKGLGGQGTEQTQLVWRFYDTLCTTLNWEVQLDVLAGTSAGGLNSALLALCNACGGDLGGLRDLWLKQGAFETLLRNPSEKAPPSLLQGDGVLLSGLASAIATIRESGLPPQPTPYTWLNVTTTLLRGEPSWISDSYGTIVGDLDHLGLFTFTQDDLMPADSDQLPARDAALALAARSSASFPGAFEPAFLPIGPTPPQTDHPDMEAYLPATASHYASDGGQLQNQPLDPALSAIFARPDAEDPVRRVLMLVVPSTTPEVAPPAETIVDPPTLPHALMADLGASRSQSIKTALDRITAHNDQEQVRSEGRLRLVRIADMAGTPNLVDEDAYRGYRLARGVDLARPVVSALTNRLVAALSPGAEVRPADMQAAAAAAATSTLPEGLPPAVEADELARLGTAAFDDVSATLHDLRRRAYSLVGAARSQDLREAWAAMGLTPQDDRAVKDRSTTRLADILAVIPRPTDEASAAVAAGQAATAWARELAGDAAIWRSVNDKLAQFVKVIADIVADSSGTTFTAAQATCAYLGDFVTYLKLPDPSDERDAPLDRLVDLHVASYLLLPGRGEVSQPVELIQVSADTRTRLDIDRSAAANKLTGFQLNHFGAFYRSSWRANDWMWGRLDGAGWIVHMLLSPTRILDLRAQSPDGGAFLNNFLAQLTALSGELGGPPPPDEVRNELEELFAKADQGEQLQPSLSETPLWLATAVQKQIAAEELASVAAQLENETKDIPKNAAELAFLQKFRSAAGLADAEPITGPPPIVRSDAVAQLLPECKVSAEKLASQVGSPLFLRTVTKAAAVTAAAVNAADAHPPAVIQPLESLARQGTKAAYEIVERTRGRRVGTTLGVIVALLAGIAMSTSGVTAVAGLGLVVIVGAIIVGVLVLGDAVLWLIPLLIVLAVVLAILSGFIPIIRDHLFPWMSVTAVPWLQKHPWAWAAFVIFVLLPTLWWLGGKIYDRFRKNDAKDVTGSP